MSITTPHPPLLLATPRDERESYASVASIFCVAGIIVGAVAAFVRWKLVVAGNAGATAANILSHQVLFRMLFAADLVSITCCVAATLLFYELFKQVSRRLSSLAMLFSFSGCAVAASASLLQAAALFVLRRAEHWNLLGVTVLPSLALLCLELRARAYQIGLAFFGIHCAVIGYLLLRSTLSERTRHAQPAASGSNR